MHLLMIKLLELGLQVRHWEELELQAELWVLLLMPMVQEMIQELIHTIGVIDVPTVGFPMDL